MRRTPAVAGRFYGGNAGQLAAEVSQFVVSGMKRQKVLGAVSPHAGLMYSGRVAGMLYSSIAMPETFILLGPNHHGQGANMAIMSSGEWEIPSAVFKIDEGLAVDMLESMPMLTEDGLAHAYEHSIELQLPFLAEAAGKIKIVPVVIGQATIEECAAAGRGMAAAIRKSGREVVIIASSDMSHYVEDAVAREMDGQAIKKILDLDPEGLYSTVVGKGITMCGFIPATIMLYAALELGATDTRLIKYATSGEVNREFDRVVGYVSITVK
jgi:MEMO1 family protein